MNDPINILPSLEQRLAEVLKRPLIVEHNLSAAGTEAIFHVGDIRLLVKTKSSGRLAPVQRACEQARELAAHLGANVVPVVGVPFMGPAGRRVCEVARVGYIDAAGNARIDAPGLFIHVEGRPNPHTDRGRPTSVFATKSSRVTRLMLLDPARWWQQQELAEQTGLGSGFVSRIVGRLGEDGLIEIDESDRLRPRSADLLSLRADTNWSTP